MYLEYHYTITREIGGVSTEISLTDKEICDIWTYVEKQSIRSEIWETLESCYHACDPSYYQLLIEDIFSRFIENRECGYTHESAMDEAILAFAAQIEAQTRAESAMLEGDSDD